MSAGPNDPTRRPAPLATLVAVTAVTLAGVVSLLAGGPDAASPTVAAAPSVTATTSPPTTDPPTSTTEPGAAPTTTPDPTTTTTTTTTTEPPPPWPSGGAQVTEQAVRIVPEFDDIVTVYNSGALTADTEARAVAAAEQAGASWTVQDAASIGMTLVARRGQTVQAPPGGFAYPMGTTVLEPRAVREFMGPDVAALLDDEHIVMSSLTASLRDAREGDQVVLTAADGRAVAFTLGGVISDEVTGGTELLMTPDAADRIGLERRSSVVIWDFDRSTLDAALEDQGLVSTRIRIRRSWDPFDPDSTLGMGQTKALLGEFAYRLGAAGSVSIDSAWTSRHLPSGRRLLNASIPIRARCHLDVEPALRAALAEVAAAGLASTINVYDANRAGGCYNPRFNRLANSAIGFLSRHTWAMAIDTNTVGSCQGCAPPDIDCRTVRIFRKHGFSWGGNYLTPDGMHFEYVGQRRDRYPYPSRFCSNIVAGDALVDPDAPLPVELTQRPTIFSDAGLVTGD